MGYAGSAPLSRGDSARFERLWESKVAELREHPNDHAGFFFGCPYHYPLYDLEWSRRNTRLAKAVLGYRLFHAGCRVNDAIQDGGLRARVINTMARFLKGSTATKARAVPRTR